MSKEAVRWLSLGLESVPAGDAWLTAREGAWAARMRYPKRLSEYRMARWCAKSAVAATLCDPPDPGVIEIGHLPEGAPAAYVKGEEFPRRISMTDRADWAVCAVAPPGIEVGCDLELVEPRTPAFVRDYFVPEEQDLALTAGEADPLLTNLIWSAKESALKVLRTGLRRDTRSVRVELLGLDGAGWCPMTVRTADGQRFPGWWQRFGPFLLTIACSDATGEPDALDKPPALDSATPGHSWLGKAQT